VYVQDRVLLQLQTALLGWEAGSAGATGKAVALARFLNLLYVDPIVPVEVLGMVAGALGSAERLHLLRAAMQTTIQLTNPEHVEHLLGLLTEQQPSIFRPAAGQGQRAALLDPLLACLHLQYVVHSLLQQGSRGYAMHRAAVDAGPVQLRVLQWLGADLDLAIKGESMGTPVTPLIMACSSAGGLGECGMSSCQQRPQQASELLQRFMMGKNREGCLFDDEGNYTELAQRREGVVRLLVEAGATLNFKKTGRFPSPLSSAAFSGLLPVLECIVQPTLAALGDESRVPPSKRELSRAIQCAARGGNVNCLRLLLGAAAGGPASEEAKAALCSMAGALNQDAMKVLLEAGVPVNGRVQGGNAPLHTLVSRPSNSEQVSTGLNANSVCICCACRWQSCSMVVD
jgi:hypothetical protein